MYVATSATILLKIAIAHAHTDFEHMGDFCLWCAC